ncbi:MAG: deoxyribodipyrimidine photo-lyase, partial [Nocardioides sp.]
MTSVMWFRRDLRASDNPALIEACADGTTLPLFVLDPALWDPSGPARRGYLVASLRALRHDVPVNVLHGNPVQCVLEAAREVDAERVHVAADYGPYGQA